jgi:YggT family protein
MLGIIGTILLVLTLLIFADVLLSWTMPPDRFPRTLTAQVTEPLYAPIRALLKPERMGGLDLSPMVLLFLIYAMQKMLDRAAGGF